jgi:long-chain acyl-CoA synthetase
MATCVAASYAYPIARSTPIDAGCRHLLHAAPMSHGSGLYIMVPMSPCAGGVQVVPESGGFDPEEVFRLVRHHPRSSLFAAPTMVRRLTTWAERHAPDTTNLRTIVYGGAPMYLADLEAALAAFGPKLAQIYGQGESPMTITALGRAEHAAAEHPKGRERLRTVGQAQTVCEVRIGDEEGNPLPAGAVGEVMVRGDSVVVGYWRNAEATAKARRQGWWCTGDVGRLDADGYLTLLDRSKDLVISGGANIYPREVEEVLLGHPKVQEVSVIGRPDAEWGEVVVAVVVASGATAAELDAHCLERMARFKRPKHYELVEALPKNAYGKVLKTELRVRYGR